MNQKLLRDLFNHDFSELANDAQFHALFFTRILGTHELRLICDSICAQSVTLGGKTIPAAHRIKGNNTGAPYAIIAQLHGNEPAGLAGILLAMALSEAGKLERDIVAVIGNPLAATQYFEAYEKNPHARQETRDAYRCGLSPEGTLYPDMNRIPVDFLTREPNDHHTRRAQELYTICQHIEGILDIHSARGNMLCITDHKHDSELKDSPIRNLLTGLAEAISAHASATVAVKTLKTIVSPLPNITSQVGIEAGRARSWKDCVGGPKGTVPFSLTQKLGQSPAETAAPQNTRLFLDNCLGGGRKGGRPLITFAQRGRSA